MAGLIQLLLLHLLYHLPDAVHADYVGQSVSDVVEEGNYTYYTLKQLGNLLLVLTTLEGDADLYVSGNDQEEPTFMFDAHYLASTTCGDDFVSLPYHLQRPVHIGVYGHPRYPISAFRLEVVIVENREFDPFGENSDSEFVNSDVSQEDRNMRQEGGGREKRGVGSNFVEEENSTLRIVLSILKGIFEILIMI